jgi:hypothetical protein
VELVGEHMPEGIVRKPVVVLCHVEGERREDFFSGTTNRKSAGGFADIGASGKSKNHSAGIG